MRVYDVSMVGRFGKSNRLLITSQGTSSIAFLAQDIISTILFLIALIPGLPQVAIQLVGPRSSLTARALLNRWLERLLAVPPTLALLLN